MGLRKSLAWLVLAGCVPLLAACGPDPRPHLFIDTPLVSQSGNVLITFRIKHRAGDKTDVDVIYSSDGGRNFHIATVVDEANTTVGLETSEKGREHSIEWDSLADGVGTTCPVRDARIRIIPITRADKGRPDTTGDFAVNNAAFSPPTMAVEDLLGVQTDEVILFYSLFDEEGDPASLVVEQSTDGGATFLEATPTPGSEPTEDLATTPTGSSHTFTWDSVADLGFVRLDDVRLRLSVTDGTTPASCQDPVVVGPFRLDNTGVVPLLFVSSPGDPSIARVDTNTGAFTTLFSGANAPTDIVVVRQATGTALMVTDEPGDRVVVIDADTGVALANLPVQDAPRGITLLEVDSGNGPAQTAYVACSGSGSIAVLDAENFSPGATLTITNVGTDPEDVVGVSLIFGSFLYVSLPSDDAVEVIDAEMLSPTSTVVLDARLHRGPGPLAVAEASTGTFVYVGNRGSDSVAVIDTLANFPVGGALDSADFPSPEGIAALRVPGGRSLALVSCPGDDSVRAIDVGAGHVFLSTIPRAALDPRGIIALPTQFGSRAYVADAATGELGSLDLDILSATGSAFPLPTISGLGAGIQRIATDR